MTDDENRIAEIEGRAVSADGQVTLSEADYRTLLASRLAWKFTAKCFSIGEKPKDEVIELAAQRIARADYISSLCAMPDWDRLSEGRRDGLRRHAAAALLQNENG